MSLPGTSRTGTALLRSLSIPGTLNSRYFYGTYEDRVSLTFHISDAYDTAATGVPCNRGGALLPGSKQLVTS